MNWVLESDVFPSSHAELRKAIVVQGHRIVDWQDDWWPTAWPEFDDVPTVFHGSLGNAARIRTSVAWQPGAYCDTARFHCTAWYPHAHQWLLNREWRCLPAEELVANRDRVIAELGPADSLFVRPDSPLKPFSGRRLTRDRITLAGLDHGFYYDDAALPVVVAPVREVSREWRYVVVNRRVIAGSAYVADGRVAKVDDPGGLPWRFAEEIAGALPPPEAVYVLDVCESDGGLRLLELNPFSGADLYACNAQDIVAAIRMVG